MIFQQENKNQRISCLLYFFIYCPLGALCPLIGQYLSTIGFSGTQVGIVTSAGTAAAVAAGVVWGKLYANTLHKRRLIAFIFLSAAVVAMLTLQTKSFPVYLVLYSLMYVFQGPVHGLCDSMVIDNGENFSIVRAFGAAGYSLCVYVVGVFAEKLGLSCIFYFYAAAFILAAVIIGKEKEPPYYQKAEGGGKTSVTELLRCKKYMKLLVCSFFSFGCSIANGTYFGYLFRDGGGNLAGIGLAFLLMAGSEAVFMLLVPLANRWISSQKLLFFGLAVCVLRFGFYACGPDSRLLLATFFLQGISNGIIWVEFIRSFGESVEPRLSGLAISVFYAIGNNFSTIICSLIGGILLDVWGARSCYVLFTLWNLTACVLYIAFGLYKDKK